MNAALSVFFSNAPLFLQLLALFMGVVVIMTSILAVWTLGEHVGKRLWEWRVRRNLMRHRRRWGL